MLCFNLLYQTSLIRQAPGIYSKCRYPDPSLKTSSSLFWVRTLPQESVLMNQFKKYHFISIFFYYILVIFWLFTNIPPSAPFIALNITKKPLGLKYLSAFCNIPDIHSKYGSSGSGLVTKLRPTLATSWTVACQIPLSMGFSKQEY